MAFFKGNTKNHKFSSVSRMLSPLFLPVSFLCSLFQFLPFDIRSQRQAPSSVLGLRVFNDKTFKDVVQYVCSYFAALLRWIYVDVIM